MNPVGKETAENFLWDQRTRSSADAAIRWSKRILSGVPAGGYRPPEQTRHGDGVYVGKAPEERSFQAKSSLPKKAKSFLLGGAGGIRTHGPRKANGFRVRLVMTTSILLHDEITSGDG